MWALLEIIHFDEPFLYKLLEKVVDLGQAHTGVLGQLTLIDDLVPV